MNALGVRPSFATGFAHSAGESEYPELWNGLVGFWPIFLGQTGGVVKDLSRNGLTGDFVNTPTWVSGAYGSAIDFDATDKISITDSPSQDVGGQLTIVLSFSLDTNIMGQFLIHDTSNYKYLLEMGADSGRIALYIRTASGVKFARVDRGDGYWADGKHHQIITTFNKNLSASRIKVYVDGTLDSSDNGYAEDILAGDEGIILGTSYDGIIDYCSIYNRALSASEIAFLSSNPTALVQLRRRAVMVSVGVAPAVGNPMLLEGQLMNSPLLSGRLIA